MEHWRIGALRQWTVGMLQQRKDGMKAPMASHSVRKDEVHELMSS